MSATFGYIKNLRFDIPCSICGEYFTVRPCELGIKSLTCRGEVCKSEVYRNAVYQRHPRTSVPCVICGNVMELRLSDIRKGIKTCGKEECITSYRRVRFKKEKNPRWRGGIKSERQAAMNTLDYKEWRNAVFVRDEFACQSCGITGGTLNAHHVFPWRDFPDLRLSVFNGVTLCQDCHRLEHV